MTRRAINVSIDLFRLPLDIVRSCVVAAAPTRTSLVTTFGGAAVGTRLRPFDIQRSYSTQVKEEGPLWDAKRKKDKMSRPEDHQSTAAGRKSPPIPKPSSRYIYIHSRTTTTL
jgi:hypothetical protein